MKEIFINVDSYNSEGIKTIQGNNNAEVYKICISKSKVRLSLVGKTVKLGYVMAGTTKGDIIEDLNITNAEQGEITFPITNKISKKDGVYTCQLAIFGADGFLEYTATFGLTVEANIFTKIAGEIENSKDLTYIERILEEAKTVSGDLKTNIPVATNLNSSLENNISNARNINTTLADTTEKSKVAATDAIEKKSQLEKSITKAKEFIDGLDGSQNIPGIRMELTELQNGLKSNQALEYSGSSISAENTLEGRTEGMKIYGKTMYKKADGTYTDTWEEGVTLESFGEKEGNKISILSNGVNLLDKTKLLQQGTNSPFGYSISGERITFNVTGGFYLKIKLEKGKVYHLSSIVNNINNIRIYKDTTFSGSPTAQLGSNSTYTHNVETGFYYLRIWTDKIDSYVENMQFESKNKTPYQPYKEDKKDILISAPLPGFDFGEDIIYEDNEKVKITRNIDTYTFTGDETMRDTTEQDEKSGTGKYKVFALTVNKTIDINKNINNNFPKKQFNVAFQNMDSEGLAITQYGVYIKILKSKLSTQDAEGLKVWLKANQTVIYFLRTTPVTEIVENCVDIDLDTYQEKTYFNILNSLPGTLDFKVSSNIGSVVQNMAKEVNNIWDVINNLLVPSIVKANGNLAMLKLNNNLN